MKARQPLAIELRQRALPLPQETFARPLGIVLVPEAFLKKVPADANAKRHHQQHRQ